MGSIERDGQLRSSNGMKSPNRLSSTSTQAAEGMEPGGVGNADQRRPIRVIPIKELIAKYTADTESESPADHTRGH